jgi:hypothetical protein
MEMDMDIWQALRKWEEGGGRIGKEADLRRSYPACQRQKHRPMAHKKCVYLLELGASKGAFMKPRRIRSNGELDEQAEGGLFNAIFPVPKSQATNRGHPNGGIGHLVE